MTQSRLMSLLEALVNVVVGLVISMVATWVICWYYDIPMTVTHNAILTFWMSVLSIVRSYVLRRVFNNARNPNVRHT